MSAAATADVVGDAIEAAMVRSASAVLRRRAAALRTRAESVSIGEAHGFRVMAGALELAAVDVEAMHPVAGPVAAIPLLTSGAA